MLRLMTSSIKMVNQKCTDLKEHFAKFQYITAGFIGNTAACLPITFSDTTVKKRPTMSF